jgi:hypothetical protein
VGGGVPILPPGRRVLRYDHIRYVVARKLDGYKSTEIARELFPHLPRDKPAAHRVRSALRKLERDASLFRTVGIVEPVVQDGKSKRLWYCLVHGEAFEKPSEANNHVWFSVFGEAVT